MELKTKNRNRLMRSFQIDKTVRGISPHQIILRLIKDEKLV